MTARILSGLAAVAVEIMLLASVFFVVHLCMSGADPFAVACGFIAARAWWHGWDSVP